MQKAKTVSASLAESGLGEDTMKLSFRVGLHSGPVTAGVLRGGTYDEVSHFALVDEEYFS